MGIILHGGRDSSTKLTLGFDFIGRKLSETCEQTKNANPNSKCQLPNKR